MSPDFTDLDSSLSKAIQIMPVQLAQPIFNIYRSPIYFKRLHLISDFILGFLRLYGHAILQLAETRELADESLSQTIDTLRTKDTHGLWSTTISALLQKFDDAGDLNVPGGLFPIFGLSAKKRKTGKVSRLSVKNTVIDSKGRKQQIETTNTPLELLINFRNRYVGHGTVYSEPESRAIFETFEPILLALINSIIDAGEIEFFSNRTSLAGYDQTSDGIIYVELGANKYTVSAPQQLHVRQRKPITTGRYFCEATDCPTASLKIGIPFGDCPNCRAPLHSTQNETLIESDRKIIATYPYFLALPYKRALEEEDGFKRLHLLKEVLLNFLKYLGLLTASEYFNSNLKLGEINRAFRNFLYRPQFGHWNAFMRSAVQALNDSGHRWFIPELPKYYETIETKPYAATGTSGIGKLIEFRNHHLGHGTVPDEQSCEALWQEYSVTMKNLLSQMDFCRNYTIVSQDKTIAWRLMGDEISTVNLREKLKTNVGLLDTQGNQMSLAPFFILPGEYFIKEVSERAKVMVYEQNTGSRIIFFSPESVHGETTNEKVLEQLNLLIRDKEKREPVSLKELDSDRWRALLQENNEDVLQSLYAEKKLIKGIYQERQDAEVALRSWIGARAGLFFLSAEAGSGKTNLLAEMNRQYAERGLDTILLRGNRIRTTDIWEEIQQRLNLSMESDLGNASFLNYSQEEPLLILIDGANEHSSSKQLFESILDFIWRHKGGHIKVVVSWRVNSKSELPIADQKFESIVYTDKVEKSKDEPLIARCCQWLKPLNKMEVEGAWNKYVNDKQDKIKRKPNFTYEELTYHDRALSDQLDNPLLLRLFLELYNGKGLPKSRGGFTSIWTLYHERLISQ